MSNIKSTEGQLGFDALLSAAETDNRERRFAYETAHLPAEMADALPFFRDLLEAHNAAMLAADIDETMRLREEACQLARKLNGGDGGILAHADAPGYVLARETAAAPGTVPIWGQTGSFEITVKAMRVRIELDGVFGIGSHACVWPGFAAHAVEPERPFLSHTGYRSFLGIYADPLPGMTPERFAAEIIAAHVERQLKGKLVAIEERYRTKSDREDGASSSRPAR